MGSLFKGIRSPAFRESAEPEAASGRSLFKGIRSIQSPQGQSLQGQSAPQGQLPAAKANPELVRTIRARKM